jgi:hypothetical protein
MNSGYVNNEQEAKENSIAEIHPFLGPSRKFRKKITWQTTLASLNFTPMKSIHYGKV